MKLLDTWVSTPTHRRGYLLLAVLVAMFSACSVQQPAVVDSAKLTAKFSHVGLESSCIGCHVPDRPTAIVKSYLHTYAIHGQDDCVECHGPTVAAPGTTWDGAYHQHNPIPTIVCSNCHIGDRPTTVTYPSGTVAQGHFSDQDCVACHLPPLTQAQAANMPFPYTHTNVFGQTTTTCLPCHQQEGLSHHGKDPGDCVKCHNVTGFNVNPGTAGPGTGNPGDNGNVTGASPTPAPTATPVGSLTATYSSINTNIFVPKCLSCHNGSSGSSAPNMSSYATLMASGTVVSFKPQNSSTYTDVQAGSMPLGASPLAGAQVQAIFTWILNGALNDQASPTPTPTPTPAPTATPAPTPTPSTCISINSPASGSTVSGSQVAFLTTDTCTGVWFESLYVDGAHIGDYVTGKVTFNTTTVTNGTHTVTITSQSMNPGSVQLGFVTIRVNVQN